MEAARYVIIGTAGHIDHGKTALVGALTGKNTDRLKEEQERGISIDIDFAPLPLDEHTVIGMVDVPGHERFVRNMVAGAVGVDGALLVIDVREGIMPQTREHIGILQLLGVQAGIIALTKCDLVDDEWISVATELTRSELKGTIFDNAEIVCTSVKTGQGTEELREALRRLVDGIARKDEAGSFRLPVDRVFSIPGFGTVVSGTVWQGTARVGDTLECLPERTLVRIRGIQVHGKSVEQASAGQRAALNLTGIDKQDIHRGSAVVTPNTLFESRLLDARIQVPAGMDTSLRHREVVHVHLGTAETVGRVLLLDSDELTDGMSGFAQILLDESIAVKDGDKCILRGGTPMTTLGGGHVIDPLPNRIHRRHRANILQLLEAKDQKSPLERLISKAKSGSLLTDREVMGELQVSLPEAVAQMSDLPEGMHLLRMPHGWLEERTVVDFLSRLQNALLEIHQQNRFYESVRRSALVSRVRQLFPDFDSRDIDWLMDEGESRELWIASGSTLKSLLWQVTLSPDEESVLSSLLLELQQAGLTVPSEDELCKQHAKQETLVKLLLEYAKSEELVVSPVSGVYWHADIVKKAVSVIESVASGHNRFTVAMVRDALSISRKYAVMLLEYLDSIHVTRRDGDERVFLGRIFFGDVTNS
jgi:selenocysteine-specific elongation factor